MYAFRIIINVNFIREYIDKNHLNLFVRMVKIGISMSRESGLPDGIGVGLGVGYSCLGFP